MIKEMPINTNLPLKRCWDMVNRVDTPEKARIAEEWLKANEIITNAQYDELMMALTWLYRDMNRRERERTYRA